MVEGGRSVRRLEKEGKSSQLRTRANREEANGDLGWKDLENTGNTLSSKSCKHYLF